MPDDVERNAWALGFGSYPRATMASCTRFLVASLIGRLPLSTWLTVEGETPAAFATSIIVTILACIQSWRFTMNTNNK